MITGVTVVTVSVAMSLHVERETIVTEGSTLVYSKYVDISSCMRA